MQHLIRYGLLINAYPRIFKQLEPEDRMTIARIAAELQHPTDCRYAAMLSRYDQPSSINPVGVALKILFFSD